MLPGASRQVRRLRFRRREETAVNVLPSVSATTSTPFELRFDDLAHPGHAFAFPCDAGGQVDLDRLSERGRQRYFYARALVGRDWSYPCVVRRAVARAA